MHLTVAKLTKNQFKCFYCRSVFAQRDGDWIDWNQMQVHLCKSCNVLTERRPERSEGSATK
jgi:hypothetical protein